MTLVDLLRRYAASQGEPTPPARPALPSKKGEWPAGLLAEYEERAAVLEFDGGFVRGEAERLAEADVLHQLRDGTEESR